MHAIHHDAQHGPTLPSLYKGRAREQGNERKLIKTVFFTLYTFFQFSNQMLCGPVLVSPYTIQPLTRRENCFTTKLQLIKILDRMY